MLSKCVLVTSLCSLLLVMYGLLITITKIEENRCKLTYMYEYPQFVVSRFRIKDSQMGMLTVQHFFRRESVSPKTTNFRRTGCTRTRKVSWRRMHATCCSGVLR